MPQIKECRVRELTITQGNIFDSEAEAIVNNVNCVGTMGKGLAKQFAIRYPDMLQQYKFACETRVLNPGSVFVYQEPGEERVILNVPTKYHWKQDSHPTLIYDGLVAIRAAMRKLNLHTIAMTALGCGEGGLDFDLDVYPAILDVFASEDVEVIVYLNG